MIKNSIHFHIYLNKCFMLNNKECKSKNYKYLKLMKLFHGEDTLISNDKSLYFNKNI
jgi:hypothetical protein